MELSEHLINKIQLCIWYLCLTRCQYKARGVGPAHLSAGCQRDFLQQ